MVKQPKRESADAEDGQSPIPSLEQFHEKRDHARFEEHAVLTRRLRTLQTAHTEQAVEVQELRKRLGLYEQLEAGRIAAPTWLAPKASNRHHAIPCMMLTDIHWDERVNPAEVEGYNCYNRAIAEQRVKRAFTGACKLTRDYIAGVDYDGFNLMLGGDLLSGIIHEELTETNQGTLCESILTVIEPLEAGINLLAKEFKRLHIAAVVGNHGRRTRKPRSKFRAKDNFDWLVYQLLAQRLPKGATMQVAEAADIPVQVYGTKYRLTHGDQFRGGSGISAELSPLLIGAHRKTKRQAAIGNPFDVMVMGHFHTSLFLPSKGIIMGGSVVGYSEFAYLNNLMPEEPQCALWLTTPERGITVSTPVFVQDRSAEGW